MQDSPTINKEVCPGEERAFATLQLHLRIAGHSDCGDNQYKEGTGKFPKVKEIVIDNPRLHISFVLIIIRLR